MFETTQCLFEQIYVANTFKTHSSESEWKCLSTNCSTVSPLIWSEPPFDSSLFPSATSVVLAPFVSPPRPSTTPSPTSTSSSGSSRRRSAWRRRRRDGGISGGSSFNSCSVCVLFVSFCYICIYVILYIYVVTKFYFFIPARPSI